MGGKDFWGDVTEEVWTLATGYWLTAFTKWISEFLHRLFGLD